MDKILLSYGEGGRNTYKIIKEIFLKHFNNEFLEELDDGAVLENIIFTTDSFVVNPIFFPGGDIGKLSIAGTINDIVAMGGEPFYISSGFIIEEGLEFETLERIVHSMKIITKKANVKIVTGDTKVVEKGKCDKLFINTSGVGKKIIDVSRNKISPGDLVIINGCIAEHGLSIIVARNEFNIQSEIKSDCDELWTLLRNTFSYNIKFMRDPTRGGLASTLNEIVSDKWGIELWEEKIPIKESTKGICEMLGFDPLTIANEGKMIIISSREDADKIIEELKKYENGKDAQIIGEIKEEYKGRVVEKKITGVRRIIDMPSGSNFPRIC